MLQLRPAVHDALHCIVPPFVLESMVRSPDARVRRFALENLATAAAVRAARTTLARAGLLAVGALAPARGRKHRLIYDMRGRPPTPSSLPGTLVRSEGDPSTGDPAVDEAYRFSGNTYDFYKKLFGRDSLDGEGMSLVSSVHVGHDFNNAFWDGAQMAYGDGDGIVFRRFTRSLDVVGHELSHAVVTFTSNLIYEGEPGALNEHFADVMGILIKQRRRRQTAAEADWLVGREIVIPARTRRALRSLKEPGAAYRDDPHLGTDPQPAHVLDRYRGSADNGGVHINSGIPNHAFYRTAVRIGGFAWEQAGAVWYHTLLSLGPRSGFQQCADATYRVAGELFGRRSATRRAVREGWGAVGIDVSERPVRRS